MYSHTIQAKAHSSCVSTAIDNNIRSCNDVSYYSHWSNKNDECRYTLARTAKFPFFIGDIDVDACVAKLVDAVKLAKKVSEQSEKLKNVREEVVVVNSKIAKSNEELKAITNRVTVQQRKI